MEKYKPLRTVYVYDNQRQRKIKIILNIKCKNSDVTK